MFPDTFFPHRMFTNRYFPIGDDPPGAGGRGGARRRWLMWGHI